MKRRQLLTTGLVVATGLAGCNTGEPDPNPTTTPTDGATATPSPDPADAPTADGLDSYTFDIVGGVDPQGPHIEEIDVRFEPAGNAVVVSSSIVVGSSSCSRVGLESLLYGKGTLQVAIAPERKGRSAEYESGDSPVACSADVAAEEYSLRVTFDGGLPERVVVREPNSTEDDDRVRVVER